MKDGKIIVISGPSGVGKTSLYKRLLGDLPDKLKFSISATTRNPRPNEADGVDYFFISEKDFQKKIKNNEFVEWAKVYNNYYGTLKSEIVRITREGKNCLLDLDVQGGMNIKKSLPESILIFIMPPSPEELKNRINSRHTDDPDTIKLRLQIAANEMNYADQYRYRVVNDDLERAYAELKDLILKNIE